MRSPQLRVPARVRLLAACTTIAAVVISGVPVGVQPASATGNGLFSVSPVSLPSQPARPYFTPVLTPGVQSKDAVNVVNDTGQPITLDLYAADARTTLTGGFTVEPDFKPKRAMGAWIHLQTSVVTLPPGGEKAVPFTYTPPATAPAGDHAGGIVAAETTPSTVRGKNGVSIEAIEAVGVPVYGTVKGPLHPGLAVTSVGIRVTRSFASQFGGSVDARVTCSITNTGDVNLSPAIAVSLGGAPTQHVRVSRMLPGSTVRISRRFGGVASLGSVTATVVARSGGTQATGTAGTVIVPWGLVGVVILVLVLVGLFVLRTLTRRRRRGPGGAGDGAADAVEPPDPNTVTDAGAPNPEDSPAGSRWW